ncbi:MAG: alpha-amylase [Armatimonadetes bacterium]|nr:alpha-amylase [Armatimonadota bacterium]
MAVPKLNLTNPFINQFKNSQYYDIFSKNEKWQDEVIYFILTDRFENGDAKNDFDLDPGNLKKYHGGDLQGIINKLDYLKELGVSVIWLTPAIENQTKFISQEGIETDGYHGYWPIDFYKVDPHIGDLEKFKELTEKAHQKGMKVILDLVLNHTAWEHPWTKDSAKKNFFHPFCEINNWDNPTEVMNCQMYGLPDLAQENPEVADYLIENAKWWISQTKIDGFRLDAVKHIPPWFWKVFAKAIHDFAPAEFILIGENFDGNPRDIAEYQRLGIDSMFDLPLYFSIINVFAHDGNMRELAEALNKDSYYDNPDLLTAFIDNHDTNRFLTECSYYGREKLKMALCFLMTINRIPALYYGTEAGMEGLKESTTADRPPENRKDMQWNNDPQLTAYFKKLAFIRKNHPALRQGEYLEMWQDEKVFAFSRLHREEEVIVVFNNSYQPQIREIPIRNESNLKDNAVLHNLLGDDNLVIKNHKIKVTLNGKESKILTLRRN